MKDKYALIIYLLIAIPVIAVIAFGTGLIGPSDMSDSDGSNTDQETDETIDTTKGGNDIFEVPNDDTTENQTEVTENSTNKRDETTQNRNPSLIARSFQSEQCQSGDLNYTIGLNVESASDNTVSGEIELDFNQNIRTTEAWSTRNRIMDVTQNHNEGHTGDYQYMQDRSNYDQNKSAYTYEFEVTTNTGAKYNTDFGSFSLLGLNIAIIDDNHYAEIGRTQIENCIRSVSSENRDIETAYVTEELIKLHYSDQDETLYNIDVVGDTNLTIVGNVTDDEIIKSADVVSSMASEFETSTTKVNILDIDNLHDTWSGYESGNAKTSVIYIEEGYLTQRGLLAHELTHSFQDYGASHDLRWWLEGSAEYIGQIAASNNGGYEGATRARIFMDNEYSDDVRLSDPSTWEKRVEYRRGAKLAYIIDREVRNHSEDANILTLVSEYNQHRLLDVEKFLDHIEKYTDSEFRSEVEQYMTSSEDISVKDRYNATYNTGLTLPTLFDNTEYTVYKCDSDKKVQNSVNCG